MDDIASGKLKARRRGRKWFVMTEDLLAYLHGHPEASASKDENPAEPDGE